MVRGKGIQENRSDTNGGTYFYDMTDLTWSLKYQPSEYRVPKTIYDVIGGNGQGGATLTGPADDSNFVGGLGKLFAAAANHANSPSPGGVGSGSTGSGSPTSASSGSSSSTGGIVGGVVGGVALLAATAVGIWALLRQRRRSANRAAGGQIMDGRQENSVMGMGENPGAPDHGGNSHWGHGIYRAPLPQQAPILDNTRVWGGTYK